MKRLAAVVDSSHLSVSMILVGMLIESQYRLAENQQALFIGLIAILLFNQFVTYLERRRESGALGSARANKLMRSVRLGIVISGLIFAMAATYHYGGNWGYHYQLSQMRQPTERVWALGGWTAYPTHVGFFVRHAPPSALTDKALEEIMDQLADVKYLNLAHTRISDQGVTSLLKLKKLNSLILADTQITDQAVRSLAGMTSIEYLDLTGTHLTQQSADILMQFGHLRHLYVGDSGLTQEMIRRIIEALPQTKVYASRHESF
jgi:hypothetical protein